MKHLQDQYFDLLTSYIKDQSELNIYLAQDFIRQLIQKDITPEEVVYIHKNVMNQIETQTSTSNIAYDFLIEMMTQFGLKLKAHQNMLKKQEQLSLEMTVASKIQNMLIKPNIPEIEGLDIGMISMPFLKINGDYIRFMEDENYFSVAVADIVGKGVPAALCMTIVKFGLDTLEYANNNPSNVLELLNQIIEKSVYDTLFVSLFYGRYDRKTHIFTYSSAGHEPAFYFDNRSNQFSDLHSEGLLLGILSDVKYFENEIELKEGDFLVIVTDGVTEFKTNLDFDSREYIKQLTLKNRHLNAQQLCELIYNEYSQMHHIQIDDDFTVVVIKRV